MTRTFFDQIEYIKTLLQEAGCAEVSNDILEQQLAGGTGGEVLMAVCAMLLTLKGRNTSVYLVIEKDAEELIAYCRSLGMYPRAI